MAVTRVNAATIGNSGATGAQYSTTIPEAVLAGDLVVINANSNGTHITNGITCAENSFTQTVFVLSETQQGGASTRWQQTFYFVASANLGTSLGIAVTPYTSNTASTFVVDVFRGTAGTISRAVQITSGATGTTASSPALLSPPPAGDLVLGLVTVSSGTISDPGSYTQGSVRTTGPTCGDGYILSADGVSTYSNLWTWGTSNTSALQTVAFAQAAGGTAAPAPQHASPGRTWKRRFKHRQQILTGSAATGPQNYNQPLNATVGFTSSESILVRKSLAATAGFTGSLTRRTARTLNAAVSFTSALTSLAVHLFTQALNATLGFTSTDQVRTGKAINSNVSFTSSDTIRTSKTLTATVAFTSAAVRRTTRLFSATAGFAGSLTRRTKRTLAATVSFTGSITSAAVHFFTQALNATVGFTGSLTTLAVHHFAQALNATLSFTGALTARRTVLKLLTATVGFTSSQAKRTGKRITAAGSFTSSIARRVATRIVATLPFTTNYDKVGSGSYAPLIDPAAQVQRNTASAAPRTNPATAAPTNLAAGSAGENPAAATARPNDAEATP